MKFENVKMLSAKDFKRLTGVRLETFHAMVQAVKTYVLNNQKTGRPNKLGIEDQVLMTLEYLREYRTYFHIGQEWGLNESNVFRTVQKIENILVAHQDFKLPGKKKLLNSSDLPEVTVIDVTEHPIEKPQKNKKATIVARKKGTH